MRGGGTVLGYFSVLLIILVAVLNSFEKAQHGRWSSLLVNLGFLICWLGCSIAYLRRRSVKRDSS